MRKKSIIYILIITIILSFGVPVVYASSSTKDEIKKTESEKSKKKSELKKIEAKISELKKSQANTKGYIESLDRELNSITASLETLQGQKAQKELEIAETEAELEEAKIVEADQYESMKLRIKFMYENGNESYVDMILTSKSISDLLNRAEYISKITEYDREMLVKYQEIKASVEATEAILKQEHAQLEELVAQTIDEQAAMEALISAKATELVRYENDIIMSEELEAEMEEELQALEQELKALEKRLKEEQSKIIYDGGQFKWPVPGYYNVTSNFGWRTHPIFKIQRLHNGIDIGAPTGTPIIAAYDGEVVVVTYQAAAGNYVMINHGSNLYTVYMHMSKFNTKVGQKVKQGDVIGYVGSTGNSTGPHLHFSVRLNGEYVNSGPYVGYYK